MTNCKHPNGQSPHRGRLDKEKTNKSKAWTAEGSSTHRGNLTKKKKEVPICKSQSLDSLLLLYLSIWAAKMELTGMKPANCWACCMCPRRKVSLEMGLEQALQCERDDLAYSAFHGFGSPAATTATASADMVVLSSSPIFSSTNCSQPNWKLLKLIKTQLKATQIVQNPIENYSNSSQPNWKLLKFSTTQLIAATETIEEMGWELEEGWEREWDLFWVWK